MELRKNMGFWEPFNIWWRKQELQNGKRPTTAGMRSWHSANAAALWGATAPSVDQTLKHAKGVRPKRLIKGYFQQYRQRRKEVRTNTAIGEHGKEEEGIFESSESEIEDEKSEKEAPERIAPNAPFCGAHPAGLLEAKKSNKVATNRASPVCQNMPYKMPMDLPALLPPQQPGNDGTLHLPGMPSMPPASAGPLNLQPLASTFVNEDVPLVHRPTSQQHKAHQQQQQEAAYPYGNDMYGRPQHAHLPMLLPGTHGPPGPDPAYHCCPQMHNHHYYQHHRAHPAFDGFMAAQLQPASVARMYGAPPQRMLYGTMPLNYTCSNSRSSNSWERMEEPLPFVYGQYEAMRQQQHYPPLRHLQQMHLMGPNPLKRGREYGNDAEIGMQPQQQQGVHSYLPQYIPQSVPQYLPQSLPQSLPPPQQQQSDEDRSVHERKPFSWQGLCSSASGLLGHFKSAATGHSTPQQQQQQEHYNHAPHLPQAAAADQQVTPSSGKSVDLFGALPSLSGLLSGPWDSSMLADLLPSTASFKAETCGMMAHLPSAGASFGAGCIGVMQRQQQLPTAAALLHTAGADSSSGDAATPVRGDSLHDNSRGGKRPRAASTGTDVSTLSVEADACLPTAFLAANVQAAVGMIEDEGSGNDEGDDASVVVQVTPLPSLALTSGKGLMSSGGSLMLKLGMGLSGMLQNSLSWR